VAAAYNGDNVLTGTGSVTVTVKAGSNSVRIPMTAVGGTVTGVSVSPANVTAYKGRTQQFTATVTGTGNPAQTVTWAIEGQAASGTVISTSGLLTVAGDETATSLTVRATSTADTSQSGTATVTIEEPTVTSVSVVPANITVFKGRTQQFSAVVTGTGDPAQTVTWSIDEAVVSGTGIDGAGLLTVAAGETATSLTVRATSTVDTSKSGPAMFTIEVLPVFTTPAQYRSMVSLNGGMVSLNFANSGTVSLSAFTIAKYETTYQLWKEVYDWAGTHGYSFANAGVEGHGTNGTGTETDEVVRKTRPVTTINWRDAIVWCNAYSEMNGKEPVYYTDSRYGTVLKTSTNDTGPEADWVVMKSTANGYRLPMEAEWEYAARGGNQADTVQWGYTYAGTSTEGTAAGALGFYAWYNANSYGLGGIDITFHGVHPVGTKDPNKTGGLYDMSGNVREWCWNWFAWFDSMTIFTVAGPNSGIYRVIRGGGWSDDASSCTVAYRDSREPSSGDDKTGFRVVCP
jgi:formylglycine-generating enzyme required for sulfatase activity